MNNERHEVMMGGILEHYWRTGFVYPIVGWLIG
jgi:hypothetical protein